MFNLFRRSKAARPAAAPKASLSLEPLDRRDCPSAMGFDDDWCGSSGRIPIPPRGGSLLEPPEDRSLVAVISTVVPPSAQDFGSIIVIGSTPVGR